MERVRVRCPRQCILSAILNQVWFSRRLLSITSRHSRRSSGSGCGGTGVVNLEAIGGGIDREVMGRCVYDT